MYISWVVNLDGLDFPWRAWLSSSLPMANQKNEKEKEKMENTSTYNGWKNYETWNVSLWIGNKEFLYDYARFCGRRGRSGYKYFVEALIQGNDYDIVNHKTPDGVLWNDPALDIEALDEMLAEIAG